MYIKILIFELFLIQLLISVCYATAESDEIDDAKLIQTAEIENNKKKCQKPTMPTDNSTMAGQEETQTLKCPKTFDTILCWEETPANQYARQQCPDWFIGFVNKKAYARRFCQMNGTWELKKNSNHTYTDYKPCLEENFDDKLLADHLPILKLIAKIGSILSLGSLIFAIILLSSFKRLHCSRNMLHLNLFASFLLFSILQLIKETMWVNSLGFPKDVISAHNNRYIMNPNVSHWECKVLTGLYRYAESSNHVSVFSEALYLNTLLTVSTFSENNHYQFYIAAGWVCPLLWLIPFVIFMAQYHVNSCWNIETGFSYFYVVPQVALIFLNFIMFINTLRVLKNKLKKNVIIDSKHNRYKKLAKSTLILVPSFSIYYIAFSVWQPFVRGKLPVELELIRLYFEIICGSFQGLAITSIYCFFNSEVRSEILTQIERKLLQRNPNMRRFSSYLTKERNSCISVATDRIGGPSAVGGKNGRLQSGQTLKSYTSDMRYGNGFNHNSVPNDQDPNLNIKLNQLKSQSKQKNKKFKIFFKNSKKRSDYDLNNNVNANPNANNIINSDPLLHELSSDNNPQQHQHHLENSQSFERNDSPLNAPPRPNEETKENTSSKVSFVEVKNLDSNDDVIKLEQNVIKKDSVESLPGYGRKKDTMENNDECVNLLPK